MTNPHRLVSAVLTLVVVLVTAAVAAGSVTPIGGIYAEPPSCKGKTASGKALQGNTDNDTITGTAAIDVLRGGGGSDNISGRGRNDCLAGQAGDDNLNGGQGDDLLKGGSGNDTLTGGPGSDILNCGGGNHDVAFAGRTDTVSSSCEVVHSSTKR
jgi:hypothetical protein